MCLTGAIFPGSGNRFFKWSFHLAGFSPLLSSRVAAQPSTFSILPLTLVAVSVFSFQIGSSTFRIIDVSISATATSRSLGRRRSLRCSPTADDALDCSTMPPELRYSLWRTPRKVILLMVAARNSSRFLFLSSIGSSRSRLTMIRYSSASLLASARVTSAAGPSPMSRRIPLSMYLNSQLLAPPPLTWRYNPPPSWSSPGVDAELIVRAVNR